MSSIKEWKRQRGSVSVFMALVFVLILSLLLVMLEAARSAGLKSKAQLMLNLGIESVMADYYGPLYENYRIFALDTGYGEKQADTELLSNMLREYTEINMNGITLDECRISDAEPLTAKGGSYFASQAIEAEKLKIAEGAMELIAQKLGMMSEQSTAAQAFTRKAEIESKFAELDLFTIKLMSLIDGVDYNLEHLTESGKLYSVKGSFIKRFFIGNAGRVNVGINNPDIYEQLKDKYINPIEQVSELAEYAEVYATAKEARIRAEKKYEKCAEQTTTVEEKVKSLSAKIDELENQISKGEKQGEVLEGELENEFEGSFEDVSVEISAEALAEARAELAIAEAELAKAKEELAEAKKELSRVQAEYESSICAEENSFSEFSSKAFTVHAFFNKTYELMYETRGVVQEALFLCSGLKAEVEEYSEYLSLLGNELSEEVVRSLDSSIETMKGYVGLSDEGSETDFELIRDTIEYDISLFEDNAVLALLHTDRAAGVEEIKAQARNIKALAGVLENFSYRGLVFDYTAVSSNSVAYSITTEAGNSIFEAMSDGWLKLILSDKTNTSNAKLSSRLLPEIEGEEEGQSSGVTNLKHYLEEIISSGTGSFLNITEGSVFSSFTECLGNGFEAIYDKAMLTMYMHDFFNAFSASDKNENTVLAYEQEYLLCGNVRDGINLGGTMLQIMLLRLIPCGIYAFTNEAMLEESSVAAELLVGFTGLPFLVYLVQGLILFIWALEQAIVETAAIAAGKNVSVVTNSESFCISFAELLIFSKSLISTKIEGFNSSTLTLSYDDYLFLLLLTKDKQTISGRALDLIQENIRYGFSENFLVNNCIVGFSAEAVCSRESAYLKLFKVTGDYYGVDGYSVSVSGTGMYR